MTDPNETAYDKGIPLTAEDGLGSDQQGDDDEDDDLGGNSNDDPVMQFLRNLDWNFEEIEADDTIADSLPDYSGPTGLKCDPSSFTTVLDCVGKCGGLDYNTIRRLAVHSNTYAAQVLLPQAINRRIEGAVCTNVTTKEMHILLGVLLRISLSPLDLGGYKAHWRTELLVVGASFSEMITIEGTQGWAQKYMSLRRFKAIRRAFPEEKTAGAAGDKCYLLRYAINQINAASQATFIPGPTLSFDEGTHAKPTMSSASIQQGQAQQVSC